MKNDETKNFLAFPVMLFAWAVTEIVRYSYYTNVLLDCVAYPLRWCRYTFFIVLYPLGVAGEMLCLMKSLPYLDDVEYFNYKLPNKLNFSFPLVLFGYCSLAVYLPGLYFLYTYMFRQRRKVLGKKKED